MSIICGNCIHCDVCYVPRSVGCVDRCDNFCQRKTQNGEQTNEEWFCQLSTAEKAEWLDGLIAYCFGVGHITESEQEKYQNIVADVVEWLKQPHNS